MSQNEEQIIAVCGLDCTACDIRKIPTDAEVAARMAGWFRSMGWLKENEGVPEVLACSMYCQGCRGDRSVHWSANCELLHCCVDEKGLEYCYECDDFVCEKLEAWAQKEPQYRDGVERLRSMKAGKIA